MILKVRSSVTSNGWRLYHAAEVQFHYETEDFWRKYPREVSVDIEEWLISDRTAGSEIKDVACISFFDEQERTRHIYTNNETYILNYNGKTIERIN